MKRSILPLPGNEALAAALAKACHGEMGALHTQSSVASRAWFQAHTSLDKTAS